jgi:hypothetical protein
MPRAKNPPPSLPLFGERPTRERAWELVERYPIGSRLALKRKRCAGACCRRKGSVGHGPYWYAFFRAAPGARESERYIGGEAKKAEVVASWAVVSEELEAAQRAALSPALERARELEARAHGAARKVRRATDRRVATIPILAIGGHK